jgi:glycosyltransferase involved in cell wall biosynthesis
MLIPLARRVIPAPVRALVRDAAITGLVPPASTIASSLAAGVTVVGPLSAPTGIGEGARLAARRFRDLGWPVHIVDLTETLGLPGGVDIANDGIWSASAGDTVLVHFNPPHFQTALLFLRRLLAGRRRIGYWAWESSRIPTDWRRSFRYLHEIWVPSEFVRRAVLAADCPIMVRVVPHPLATPASLPCAAPSHRPLVVLSVFAYDSGFERKNPIGAVTAFRQAFGDRGDVRLIVKTRGRSLSGEPERRFADAISGMHNIELIDKTLSAADYAALLATADIFLSLHRAEGFGQPMAEAMLAGKPVVATGWSGNLEFMTADTACLVPVDIAPATDERGAGRESVGVWAEPSVSDAAQWLRRLLDPALRTAIGERARRHATGRLGLAAFAAAISGAFGAMGLTMGPGDPVPKPKVLQSL